MGMSLFAWLNRKFDGLLDSGRNLSEVLPVQQFCVSATACSFDTRLPFWGKFCVSSQCANTWIYFTDFKSVSSCILQSGSNSFPFLVGILFRMNFKTDLSFPCSMIVRWNLFIVDVLCTEKSVHFISVYYGEILLKTRSIFNEIIFYWSKEEVCKFLLLVCWFQVNLHQMATHFHHVTVNSRSFAISKVFETFAWHGFSIRENTLMSWKFNV